MCVCVCECVCFVCALVSSLAQVYSPFVCIVAAGLSVCAPVIQGIHDSPHCHFLIRCVCLSLSRALFLSLQSFLTCILGLAAVEVSFQVCVCVCVGGREREGEREKEEERERKRERECV